jgi:hypothetical protein
MITSNPSTFGKEIQIIRQRFFIDYTSKSNKYYSEEYTIRCLTVNEKGIDNVFIRSPKLLPNLKIYDSDGTQLALITNRLSKALINNLLKHSKNTEANAELTDLLHDMDEQRVFLLWIKLPADRRLMPKEARTITLEYDTPREELEEKDQFLEFHSAPYEVFYTIRIPEDYEFGKEEIEIYDYDGTTLKDRHKTWKKKPQRGDPFYFNENHGSVSIRISPNTNDSIRFIYSFKAKKNITALPQIVLCLLIGASIVLVLSNLNYYLANCGKYQLCFNIGLFAEKQAEIGIGIIGASLIVPNLIHNQEIRDSLKYLFLAPLIIAIFGIFV